MKILIIEDNLRLASRIEDKLKKWHISEIAHTGQQGVQLARTHLFDLIILDLGLPDMDGAAVCKEIREDNSDVPILILTAESSTHSQVALLDYGADDYMTKPFQAEELRARVHCLMRRRRRGEARQVIIAGTLCINPAKRTVSRNGTPITLRRKEFDILEYLALNPGRILSRQNIIDHAWHSTSGSWPGSVDVHMKKLRDAIDKPFGIHSVKTIYGVGYSLEADDTPVEASTEASRPVGTQA